MGFEISSEALGRRGRLTSGVLGFSGGSSSSCDAFSSAAVSFEGVSSGGAGGPASNKPGISSAGAQSSMPSFQTKSSGFRLPVPTKARI